jgi:hypothetical protein
LSTLPRSKTNQTGEQVELVVLPRAGNPARCPVTALTGWTRLAAICDGPLFRPVGKNNKATARPLHPESINTLRTSPLGCSATWSRVRAASSLRRRAATNPTSSRARSPARPGLGSSGRPGVRQVLVVGQASRTSNSSGEKGGRPLPGVTAVG